LESATFEGPREVQARLENFRSIEFNSYELEQELEITVRDFA